MTLSNLSFAPLRRAFALAPILGLGLVITPGCAMLKGPAPEPEFVTVAIVTRGQSDIDLEADSTTDSALVGGGAGAVGAGLVGAGTGAAVGAATGPFAPAAIPIGAAVFGAFAAAAGATTGLVVGALQGLPEEKAEQVTQILVVLAEGRDFQGELRSSVESSVPEGRRATSGRADATAVLQLSEIELEQHMSDVISLHMEAAMTLEWRPEGQALRSKSYDYVYDTPERHVDQWLLDDGKAFDVAFTGGIDDIARRMLRDIKSPASR